MFNTGRPNFEHYKRQMILDMSGMNGNPMETLVNSQDNIDSDDLDFEDVSPTLNGIDKPILTKKGKLVLAVIVLAGFGYWLWQRNKQAKANQPAPMQQSVDNGEQQSQEHSNNQELDSQKANATVNQVTQENGMPTEGE